jgi:autotransporter-associated beta strand protein
VTVSANKTVTVTAGGTLTLASPSIVDIESGATLTWQSQTVSANSAGGITKNSAGTLDLGALSYTTLTGGFILNAGKVIVSGTKSFGTAAMTINGGTVQSSGNQTFTPTSLTIGGDFGFAGTGNDTWNQNVSLGASTRSIANNTTSTATRTFSGIISGGSGAGLTFTGTGGSGGIVLNNANTYTGDTTISAGTLKLGASSSIANSPNIIVNGTFDVSAVSGFTIGASQTLKGSGTVSGAVTLSGTLSPGNSSIATLTLNSAPSLSGTCAMDVDKTSGTTSADKIARSGSGLAYGGTLTVTKTGADTLTSGDSFTLFTITSGSFSGWFSTVTVPALASGLSWDTNRLATTGVLDIYSFTTNAVQTMSAVKNTATSLLISKLVSKASSSRGTVVLSSVSSASGATVSINGDHINYTPPGDFTGTDTFKAVLTDGHGSITATVVVTVNAINASSTLTALDVTSDPGHVILTASGLPSTTYKVQASDDGGSTWNQIGTATTAANGVLTYTDTTPSYPMRWYRLAQ